MSTGLARLNEQVTIYRMAESSRPGFESDLWSFSTCLPLRFPVSLQSIYLIKLKKAKYKKLFPYCTYIYTHTVLQEFREISVNCCFTDWHKHSTSRHQSLFSIIIKDLDIESDGEKRNNTNNKTALIHYSIDWLSTHLFK